MQKNQPLALGRLKSEHSGTPGTYSVRREKGKLDPPASRKGRKVTLPGLGNFYDRKGNSVIAKDPAAARGYSCLEDRFQRRKKEGVCTASTHQTWQVRNGRRPVARQRKSSGRGAAKNHMVVLKRENSGDSKKGGSVQKDCISIAGGGGGKTLRRESREKDCASTGGGRTNIGRTEEKILIASLLQREKRKQQRRKTLSSY